MFETFRKHRTCYLSEGVGLATFVFFAGGFSTLLMSPSSPVAHAIEPRLAKDALLGLLMFPVVAWGIAGAPWMKRSGGHINPAVTLAFWRLGKIGPLDAAVYVVAQFVGALVGVSLARLAFGKAFADPAVAYGATKPGPGGPAAAFAVEFAITFVLMLVVILMASEKRLRSRAHLVVAGLISLYLVFAVPYSGMSMNPARSTGSSVFSGHYDHLWIYFVAPVSAALLAAETVRRRWPERLCGPRYPLEGETR